MDPAAFLSIRLPPEVRNRVKAAAAARGQTVQDLVGNLVDHFLAEQDRKPPTLAVILTRLREHEAALRRRGIPAFGSSAPSPAARHGWTATSTWSPSSTQPPAFP